MIRTLIFTLILCPTLLFAQHKISGTFTPASNFKAALLYRLDATSNTYISNANIIDGNFELDLADNIKPGAYRIVYALPQEQYKFNFIYNNEDIVFKFNQQEGVTFLLSKENKVLSNYRSDIQNVKNKINAFYGQANQSPAAYTSLISELKTIQKEAETKSEGMLAQHFIKAEKPYMPTGYEDAPTYFNNYKSHYFSAIDFNDPVLQNSDFLVDMSMTYIFTFVDRQRPNRYYINNIDDVMAKTANQKAIKKAISEVLWNQFKSQQNEEVANYVADNYLKALLDPVKDEMLLNDIEAFKNTAIGAKAPDFSWPSKQGSTSLSSLSGKDYYIVTFWSSTCSHCLTELPVLKNYLSGKSNIQVLAVGLEDERTHWEKTIADYPDFTQIYAMHKWDNPIPVAYGVSGTPSFFVLDKNKTIVAKPDDVKALMTFLDTKK